MKKTALYALTMVLAACAFPRTPGDGDLLNATHNFQPELFSSGARGQVIVSLADNVSDDGWFGKNYTDGIAFKNLQSGEVFFLSTKKGVRDYDTAMLTIGEYEVTNLYLQYVYTTTSSAGNTTITTTHVETDENYQGDCRIRFTVRPGRVSYIGHFDLIRAENRVGADGVALRNSFKLSDHAADIPQKQRDKWRRMFGVDFDVAPAKITNCGGR